MRNTRPLLSRPLGDTTNTKPNSTVQPAIPSIRFAAKTPSVTGLSSEASSSLNNSNFLEGSSWGSFPAPVLVPKSESTTTTKHRIVPKKSKLGLLGVVGSRDKENRSVHENFNAFRTGDHNPDSNIGNDDEIYVDSTIDPDIGEILVVKKKKSRAALNDIHWGALGEVTNAPVSGETGDDSKTLKVKGEEKAGWWTIGRGRKDSKDKSKEGKENKRGRSPESRLFPMRSKTIRSKTPEPLKPANDVRTRFNSLDFGTLFNSTAVDVPSQVQIPEPYSRSGTPNAGSFFAPPCVSTSSTAANGNGNKQGSIAVRAMRSVRSLAQIGGWAHLRKESVSYNEKEKAKESKKERKEERKEEKRKEAKTKEKRKEEKTKEKRREDKTREKRKEEKMKEKEKEGKTKEKKNSKNKVKDKEKRETAALGGSTSSFEAGMLSPAMSSSSLPKEGSRTLRSKVSILGLGLPSSIRLPTLRSGSTASVVATRSQTDQGAQSRMSESSQYIVQNRLSLESSDVLDFGRGRSGSVMSTLSSLRPVSTISNHSRNSMASGTSQNSHSNGSGCSVRWDEEGLETVREVRRKEREEKVNIIDGKVEKMKNKKDKKKKADKEREKDSQRSSESRKRITITDIFSDIAGSRKSSASSRRSSLALHAQGHAMPLLTVEEATNDGLDVPANYHEHLNEVPRIEFGTPSKKARPRPVSEHMLGKGRPRPMYQDDEDNAGVLSILDAATNDLAQLIMTLNLEATPSNTPPLGYENPTAKPPTMPESPSSKTLSKKMASIASLRSYARSLKKSGSQLLLGSPKNSLRKKSSKSGPETLIGQQIAPWSKLVEGLSPKKSMTFSSPSANKEKELLSPASISGSSNLRPSISPPGTFRKGHRRQITPAPEPEPAPVFQPLRPAVRPRIGKSLPSLTAASLPESVNDSLDSSLEVGRGGVVIKNEGLTVRAARSSMTFGTRSPKSKNKSGSSSNKIPIPPETRRMLGMSGTLGMGGSDIPAMYAVPETDAASDPDSDIPDELQFILKESNSDSDEASFKRLIQAPIYNDVNDSFPILKEVATKSCSPSGQPPTGPLPVPSGKASSAPVFCVRIIDEDEGHIGILSASEKECTSEFDFTGELKKLDESAESDRKSFVEQLEAAFKSPAKVELHFDLLGKGLLKIAADVPPIPKLPFAFPKNTIEEKQVQGDDGHNEDDTPSRSTSEFDSCNQMFKAGKQVEDKEPTMVTTAVETSGGIKSVLELSSSQILNMKEPSSLEMEDKSVRVNMSTTSTCSNGELNTSFKFGGRSKFQASPTNSEEDKPLTLSDIIPPLSHAHSLAESSFVQENNEDSVLKSIYAKAKTGGVPLPRPRLGSNASSKRRSRMTARSFLAQSRPASGISFTGLDSFEELRRTFEFCGSRPTFYPPPASDSNKRVNQQQRDSVLSIASISSYGRVINPGLNDPFGFSLSQLQERPSSEDMSSATFSFSVDDTFSFLQHQSRRIRVDSDASSFYFRPTLPNTNRHSRDSYQQQESSISYTSGSGVPPVSFYNRSFAAHRGSGSSTSASPAYATHGASGGRAAWAKHRQDSSIDSVLSDISALRLGRPGVGDKMFDMCDQEMSLSAVTISPLDPEHSSLLPQYGKSSSYDDSIMDASEEQSSEDSFGKTDSRRHVGMESIFGVNDSGIGARSMPSYRPVSVISIPGAYVPPQEDDTWISMIGGGHVRRNSVASNIQASPCARVEKRKTRFQPMGNYEQRRISPKMMAKIIEIKPSTISASSSHFGDGQMIQPSKGLLERKSLEDSCLVTKGEDFSLSFRSALLSRPAPVGRSRSSTCTSSSGSETPPLSSDGSSISGGSQSSLDLAQLDSLLANASFSMSSPSIPVRNRIRPRARGQGHCRRYSVARTSRTSIYETIEEEPLGDSPAHTMTSFKHASPTTTIQPVIVVDSELGSIDMTVSDSSFWDSERGITALDKCYALRHEAEGVVDESKRLWVDTPFSIFAVQNFQPPWNREGMKALLQHSIQNYGHLPSELRRRRSRTLSRPSPYPLGRVNRVFYPPESTRASPLQVDQFTANTSIPQIPSTVLQEISVNSNVAPSPAPSFKFKVQSPAKSPAVKRTAPFGQPPIRPRVGSNARRAALDWTKRNVKSSNGDQKENKEKKEKVGYGSIRTAGESLRLNRPRPRGRTTHTATQLRPIRV